MSTPFARDVPAAIDAVPAGQTVSYAGLTAAAGRPRRIRAAARVWTTNLVPLVIGCRRVVRSDGSVGDYRGGSALTSHLLRRAALVTAR